MSAITRQQREDTIQIREQRLITPKCMKYIFYFLNFLVSPWLKTWRINSHLNRAMNKMYEVITTMQWSHWMPERGRKETNLLIILLHNYNNRLVKLDVEETMRVVEALHARLINAWMWASNLNSSIYHCISKRPIMQKMARDCQQGFRVWVSMWDKRRVNQWGRDK